MNSSGTISIVSISRGKWGGSRKVMRCKMIAFWDSRSDIHKTLRCRNVVARSDAFPRLKPSRKINRLPWVGASRSCTEDQAVNLICIEKRKLNRWGQSLSAHPSKMKSQDWPYKECKVWLQLGRRPPSRPLGSPQSRSQRICSVKTINSFNLAGVNSRSTNQVKRQSLLWAANVEWAAQVVAFCAQQTKEAKLPLLALQKCLSRSWNYFLKRNAKILELTRQIKTSLIDSTSTAHK
jgi:hypothetical protein